MDAVTRRGFIKGIAGILVAASAPALILRPGILMPVRQIIRPDWPMREIFAYDINIDAMRVRYDVLIGGEQLYVGGLVTRAEFNAGTGPVTQSAARKMLLDTARARGLDITKATPLALPMHIEHARILT